MILFISFAICDHPIKSSKRFKAKNNIINHLCVIKFNESFTESGTDFPLVFTTMPKLVYKYELQRHAIFVPYE